MEGPNSDPCPNDGTLVEGKNPFDGAGTAEGTVPTASGADVDDTIPPNGDGPPAGKPNVFGGGGAANGLEGELDAVAPKMDFGGCTPNVEVLLNALGVVARLEKADCTGSLLDDANALEEAGVAPNTEGGVVDDVPNAEDVAPNTDDAAGVDLKLLSSHSVAVGLSGEEDPFVLERENGTSSCRCKSSSP